jgi:hypothetical protein
MSVHETSWSQSELSGRGQVRPGFISDFLAFTVGSAARKSSAYKHTRLTNPSRDEQRRLEGGGGKLRSV